ncbi:MAG: RNA 2',3'-cyclic phosphodiesterase [Anaerolineae bacterium]|nr:RNA 2',3'-cyclic phosphodiesterase [Anaerolineae bacterium]
MSQMLRLFIAVELPSSVLAALARLQDELAGAVPRDVMRWSRPTGMHLTLKFLGDVPSERRGAVEAGMAQARAQPPFTLSARGIGCFPNFKSLRVVWVGLAGQMDALHALRDTVEAAIAPLGYPTEERPFNPHLTLGRVQQSAPKRAVAELGQYLAAAAGKVGELGRIDVTGISLMHSDLRPDGAIYTRLSHVDLEGADDRT